MTRPPGERLYRLLLRCYPGEFRDEYEREMLLAYRDMRDGKRAGGALALWWRLIVDAAVRAPGEHLDVLRQDVRYGLRTLRRAPIFALTAIATLALGIGANTAIFSVVHGVALRPLPYDTPERLVRIWEDNPDLAISGFAVSLPNFVSWRERARTTELAAWVYDSVTLPGTGDAVRVPSLSATADFFALLGVRPLSGRLFEPGDEAPSAPPVALVTEGLWRRHFGSDPGLVGRTLRAGGPPVTVVGVIPDRVVPADAEFFQPLRIDLAEEDRGNHTAQVLGRLRPHVTPAQAHDEFAAIARQLAAEFPDTNRGWGITMSSLYDWVIPEATRTALFVLLAGVGCVLLIACANVASLTLARAADRGREAAVRMAIGAGRRRLVRQMLTEGVLVTALGGALGVAVAYWGTPLMRQWLPADLPRLAQIGVNGPVLMFALALCSFTSVLFAALPAVASTRGNVLQALRRGGRGTTTADSRLRHLLTAGQVALATMLLVSAGLFVQSLIRLQAVGLGFDPSGVATGMMGLPDDRYRGPEASWDFYQRLLARLTSAAAVEAAAVTSGAPFDGGNTGMPVEAVGASRLEGRPLQADWRMVSPSYFDALRIPLLRGRLFTGHREADRGTMIISAGMAQRIWGDDDPLGRTIAAGPAGQFTVVGIVGDVRNLTLARDPGPTMYISTANYVRAEMTVLVRVRGEPALGVAAIREAVRALDPELALYNLRTIDSQLRLDAAEPRLNATLIGFFAVVAALLASIGIYGVLAYQVSQRRQEIGIRIALGATRQTVVRLVMARGLWLTGSGLIGGIAGALAAAQWMGSLLFEVPARDPLTFAAATALVTAASLVSSYVPAWRASRVDPLTAVRAE